MVLCAAECCFADGARRKGGDTLCVLWGREVWCALISSSFVSTTCAAWVAKRSARKRVTLCRVVYGVCSRTFGLCLLGGNLKTARLQSATLGHCRVFEKGERERGAACASRIQDSQLESLCLPLTRLNGERLAQWVLLAKPLIFLETFGLVGLGESCQSMSNRAAGASDGLTALGATSRFEAAQIFVLEEKPFYSARKASIFLVGAFCGCKIPG